MKIFASLDNQLLMQNIVSKYLISSIKIQILNVLQGSIVYKYKNYRASEYGEVASYEI